MFLYCTYSSYSPIDILQFTFYIKVDNLLIKLYNLIYIKNKCDNYQNSFILFFYAANSYDISI